MSIGYACLTVGVPNTGIKGCLLKNANEEKLAELIRHNLTSLKNIIEYNDANNVRLFRISSDIIPFGSSPPTRYNGGAFLRKSFPISGTASEKPAFGFQCIQGNILY